MVSLVRSTCVAAALAGFSLAASASVTILGQPGTFTTIQAAVDAAVDGDVLLVGPGTNGGFTIDGKGIAIVALPGTSILHETCTIRNVTGARTVLLSGVRITAPDMSTPNQAGEPGLVLESNTAHLRFQGCTFRGGSRWFSYSSTGPFPSGQGVLATDCTRVVFTQCTLRGGDSPFIAGEDMYPGGDALEATGCTIALYECTVRGGTGTSESNPTGGLGGAGLRVTDFGVVVSGGVLQGGNGGGGDYIGCSISGDGGDALVLNEAQAQVLDTTFVAGPPGSYYTCSPGARGEEVVSNDGVLNVHSGTRRMLTGPTFTTDQASLTFDVVGEAGDRVWLVRAFRPAFRFMSAYHGLAAVPYPWMLTVSAPLTLDANGTGSIGIVLGDVISPQAGVVWYVQGVVGSVGGDHFLTSPLQLVIQNN